MIANEVQYRSTKAHLRQFNEAAAALEGKLGHADEPALARLELDAVRAQADDLRAEIDEYEQLRSGAVSIFEASTLAELATLLVKSRIARGWTQGQLADALGIAEQQVQRYESTAYRAASLARICDVAAALGVDFSDQSGRSCAIPMPHDGLLAQRTSTRRPSPISSIVPAPAAIPTTNS